MKFNKDTFLNDITDKVQSAIDKNLITKEDVETNNTERLHGFIRYALADLIEDRKFAIDVLKDFNYDEKTPWDTLQDEYGIFKSLMDIALINLWKFLQAEGCTEYKYYKYDNRQNGSMLDVIRDENKEDMEGVTNGEESSETPMGDIDFGAAENTEDNPPRRKLRLAR